MKKYALIIQKNWRAFKCKKTIKKFSKPPCDLWRLIVSYIKDENKFLFSIDKLFLKKIVILSWKPPKKEIQSKLRLIRVISHHVFCFRKTTVIESINLCYRLLRYSLSPTCNFFINSCIERISNQIEYITPFATNIKRPRQWPKITQISH